MINLRKYTCLTSVQWLTCSGILLFSSCGQEPKEIPASKPAGADSVKVFVLMKEPVKKQLVFPSELTAFEKAELFAKATGYIKTIKADIGDPVQKGQILATIEEPELVSNFEQAKADAEVARSRYLSSKDVFQRMETAAKVSGTIATGEMEKSRNQMKADEAAVDAAKAKLATYAQLRDYLIIRAPFSGRISQRNADAGTLVGSSNPKPIFIIENTATLRLRVPVQEALTGALPDSSSIAFTVDARPDKTYYAKLTRKSGNISKDTRTEIWEFMYNNTTDELKSGMYANASIRLNRPVSSFAVPPSAIATTLEKRFVIRLKNGKAEWVDVRNGINTGEKIEIFGNLSEGDTLLVKGTDEIKPATPLLIKK